MDKAFESRRKLYLILSAVICVCAGFGYAWSVLQNPIITVHGWEPGSVSLAYTITVLCSTMAPLFFAPLIKRLGIRNSVILGAVLYGAGLILCGSMSGVWQLYLFYGFMTGLGCGFIYPRMMAYVVTLYPERTGMASGVGTAAYGSGAILWAPVAARLIEGISLAAAFRMLGAFFLIVIVLCTLILREAPAFAKDTAENAGQEKPSVRSGVTTDLNRAQMVKTGTFYQMLTIFSFGLVAGVIVISQASPILQEAHGFSPARAAVFVSVFAACNMAGRFFFGGLSDRIGIRNVMIFTFALCTASMLVLALQHMTGLSVLAMGLAAACYGGFASVLTPLTAATYGPTFITENYGVMYVVFGIASFIGPMLVVRAKAASGGSFTMAFFIAAALAVVGLILTVLMKERK